MKPMPFLKSVCVLPALAGALLLTGCGEPKPPAASGPVTPWRSFVSDLTNTMRLARMDVGGTRLISSYDRKGGNDDWNNFERAGEPGWVVLADLKGPGVVRRWWTTGQDFGHQFRVYFDGEKTPRLSGSVEQIFGSRQPFVPPLAQNLNYCWWSYVPLTFQKSLRIETAEPNIHQFWGPRKLFTHLNVQDLPGQNIETMPRDLSASDQAQLAAVALAWQQAVAPVPTSVERKSISAPAGKTAAVYDAEGPGILSDWSLTPVPPAGATARVQGQQLSDLLLRVFYDGATQPSIEVPLGDFFGQIGHRRSFGSLGFANTTNELKSRLAMPFKKSIRIEVENRSALPADLLWHGTAAPGSADGYGYLHAAWAQSGPAAGQPHVFADFTGRGHLAGIFLNVTGDAEEINRPWWILEGDETFFVDGETKPSWHGTGLEDYFNGGWYYRNSAFAGLHGIFDRTPFTLSQYRLQLVDPLAFSKSLHLQIERGDQNVSKGFFRSVTLAYLDAPTPSPRCPPAAATRVPENPYQHQTLMIQLCELERINNFAECIELIRQHAEDLPSAEENGVLALRTLEYRRLLGQPVTAADMQPFLDGKYGPLAAEQAKLLTWFYEKPGRALVAMNANGPTRVFLDGQPLFAGDHPFNLFVTGVELPDGPHTLAAETTMKRASPWTQLAIRTQTGIAGTTLGTKATLKPGPKWNLPAGDDTAWGLLSTQNLGHAIPEVPMLTAIPNAYILLTSKTFSAAAQDWVAHQGKAYYRVELTTPLHGIPEHNALLTGLPK